MQVKHDSSAEHDTSADLARLLDEGYEVRFIKVAPGYGMGDFEGYLVNMTGPLGSEWRGAGQTPGEALRSVWPLDDEDGFDDADDDDLEPYCSTCSADIGIFWGHGDDWHHYRGEGTAASRIEIYDAGHAPAVAWRPAGDR